MVESDHTEQHRPRGRWSGTCPRCPGKLAESGRHDMTCIGCGTTITPPHRAPASWEATAEAWEDYSRPGNLVPEWGRSTVREPWSPPRDKAKGEEPAIRDPHVRGHQDALLDATVGAYVAGTARLTDTLRALVQRARTAAKGQQRASKPKGAEDEIAAILFAHLDETAGTGETAARAYLSARFAPGAYRLPRLYRRQPDGSLVRNEDRDNLPPVDAPPEQVDAAFGYWVRVAEGIPAIRDGILSALALLMANLLNQRGVDASACVGAGPGDGEPFAMRLPRAERFAGSHHAVAIALSDPEIAPRPSAPAAPGKHPIPQGLQFGTVTVHPSHSGSGRAPGESGVIDMLDAQRALGSLTADDLDILATTLATPPGQRLDPNRRKQRERAWTRATDALREQGLIPPRKRKPARKAAQPEAADDVSIPVAPIGAYQPAMGLAG
jgi:hypothetical protein